MAENEDGGRAPTPRPDDGIRREMTPEELRRHGREVVDWVAAYRGRIEELPVLSRDRPGDVRSRLPAAAPERGEEVEAVLRDLDELILPGVTHWQSPSFFAYFPANASAASVLGDLLSSGIGVQGMLWATSPACTELEAHVMDWLVGMLDLPEDWLSGSEGGGVIQDSASSSNLCALLAARERATGGAGNRDGVPPGLVAYCSTQTHSSVEKGARIAGIGSTGVRALEVDGRFRLRPDRLEAAIVEDREAGRTPFFVCATVGTTSSLAVDPLDEIGEICRREGLWLHVDAAMAGTAALCGELRWIHRGLEHADSYVFDAHKWFGTAFDCSCFWVRDRKALIDSLSITPEYLRNRASETGEVWDYRDWHVPLGRRFRALKLWLTIRWFGVEGLRTMVRRHVELARALSERIEADPRFELVVPTDLDLVCFRHVAGDDVSREILEAANATGRLYLTHTRLGSDYTIRFCVGQTTTERRHVDAAWETLSRLADELAPV